MAPPIVETWADMVHRLLKTQRELEAMLAHLKSRKARRRHRKVERALRREIEELILWIDVSIWPEPPATEEERKELVLGLYEFDLHRPCVVDAFFALLDELGEAAPEL